MTVKYSPQGARLWVAKYGGGSVSADASSLAVDVEGNVYVTGRVCIALDVTGNCIDVDVATLKYDTNGNLLWAATYADGGYGWPIAVALDGAGNVYVGGIVCFPAGNICDGYAYGDFDFFVVKYASGGARLWSTTYPNVGSDFLFDLAVGRFGSVYLTGKTCAILDTLGRCSNWAAATMKLDLGGNLLWVAKSASNSAGHALALDDAENVYVAGWACPGPDWTSCSYSSYATTYDNNGKVLWEVPFAVYYLWPTDIAVDATGNVYVTGAGETCAACDADFTVIKLAANGGQLWTGVIPKFGEDTPTNIAVDGLGNVFVTGYVCNDTADSGCSDYHFDYLTAKYSADGVQQWTAGYRSHLDDDNYNQPTIAVDATGNVYVAGTACTATTEPDFCTSTDYATLKYPVGK